MRVHVCMCMRVCVCVRIYFISLCVVNVNSGATQLPLQRLLMCHANYTTPGVVYAVDTDTGTVRHRLRFFGGIHAIQKCHYRALPTPHYFLFYAHAVVFICLLR